MCTQSQAGASPQALAPPNSMHEAPLHEAEYLARTRLLLAALEGTALTHDQGGNPVPSQRDSSTVPSRGLSQQQQGPVPTALAPAVSSTPSALAKRDACAENPRSRVSPGGTDAAVRCYKEVSALLWALQADEPGAEWGSEAGSVGAGSGGAAPASDDVGTLFGKLTLLLAGSVDAQIAFTLTGGYPCALSYFQAYPDQ
ncbi:hypothetical protein QJQ45_022827, partial [Haematococcus lacustris]